VFLGREIHEQRNYSEKIAAQIDEEVTDLIKTAEDKATAVLKKYRKELDAVSARLIKTRRSSGKILRPFSLKRLPPPITKSNDPQIN